MSIDRIAANMAAWRETQRTRSAALTAFALLALAAGVSAVAYHLGLP